MRKLFLLTGIILPEGGIVVCFKHNRCFFDRDKIKSEQ